jgi:hypothetical protein
MNLSGDRHVKERIVQRGQLLGGPARTKLLGLDLVDTRQIWSVVARAGKPMTSTTSPCQDKYPHTIH